MTGWLDPNSNNVLLETTDGNGNLGVTEAGQTEGGSPFSTFTDWNQSYVAQLTGGLPSASSNANSFDGLDIWHCQGCGNIWNSTAGGMNTLTEAYAALYGGAFLGANFGPAALSAATRFGSASAEVGKIGYSITQQLLADADVVEFLSDAIQGFTPGAVPITAGGLTGFAAGEVVQHWSQISQYGQNVYQQVQQSVPH